MYCLYPTEEDHLNREDNLELFELEKEMYDDNFEEPNV